MSNFNDKKKEMINKRHIEKSVLQTLTDTAIEGIYKNEKGEFDYETEQTAGDVQDERIKADERTNV